MPTTYIVDPTGVIRHVACGFDTRNVQKEIRDMDAALKTLLP